MEMMPDAPVCGDGSGSASIEPLALQWPDRSMIQGGGTEPKTLSAV
jgi:hypothetical protein